MYGDRATSWKIWRSNLATGKRISLLQTNQTSSGVHRLPFNAYKEFCSRAILTGRDVDTSVPPNFKVKKKSSNISVPRTGIVSHYGLDGLEINPR
jgi:hypothetical protein